MVDKTVFWKENTVAHSNRSGKVNVKVLAVVVVALFGIGISIFGAREIQRSARSGLSLETGMTAYAGQDWPTASKSFKRYLDHNPDDLDVLRKYAESLLAARPLSAGSISGAIAAYRRIVQLDPLDAVACEKLVMLYAGIGNFEEMRDTARTRLEHVPDDRQAPLWLASALIRLNKPEEARQALETLIAGLEALPTKHVEYVRACATLSEITASGSAEDAKTKALEWLDRGVNYAPEFVEALVYRAKFYRLAPEIPGLDEKGRLALARRDLETCDARGTDNPRIRLFLTGEWMAHGELDRATTELDACEKLPPEALPDRFSDIEDWTTAKFLVSVELAMRKGSAPEAAALADKALASHQERRHRAQILPPAILAYAATGKAPDARRCLDEYLDLIRAQGGTPESARRIAGLQALVAGVENRPYAVIDALAPVVGDDTANPELWRMLAEAYSRIDQTGRAVNALNQYRRLNPQDPRTMLELARQYSKLGDWRNAFEAAGTAESQDPTGLGPKVLRIGAAINLAVGRRGAVDAGQLQKLSAELANLRQAHPDQLDIRMLQAIVTGYLGQPEEVERQLKLAIEECSSPLRAQLQLAGHYLRAKRMTEAVAACEAACRSHPEMAEPWLALADVHVANTDYDAARKCLQQGLSAVQEQREKRSVTIKLALLEVIHGNRVAGIGLLRDTAAQDPREVQARLLLLGIRDIREDRAAAEKLVSELRQAEGERGVWWRAHQASLWLTSPDWRNRQQEIASLLTACTEADPGWSAPVLLLAQMYERLGDVKRVEDVCRQALLVNPSAADIAGRLLALLERQGRFSDAEKVLQQVEVDPRLVSAWQIRIALGAGDLSRAVDELKLRAASDEKDADSRIQLARLVYQQTRDVNQALQYLKEAQAGTSDARTLVAVKASILKAEGKAAEALQVLDDYVGEREDFTAYWMRAVYLTEARDLERAEKDYRKLTTFTANSEAGYELLGGFYVATERLDQGIAAVEEGLNAHPESLRLKRNLMRLLFRRAQAKDVERATEILASLEAQLPQDAELLTIRAAQMLEQPTPQSLASARTNLENAVRLEPTAVNAHYTLIGIAMRQEDYKAACDYAVRALQSNPGNPALLLARGRAELALGYAPMATRLTREVLQQDPNSMDAVGLLADIAMSSKDPTLLQEVRTLIDSGLARDPKSERLLVMRAHVLSALSLPKEAIPALEAYSQTPEGSRSVLALVTMADLYRITGDADKSREKIEQAQRLDPASQTVVHARLLWLLWQKRPEELKGISSAYLSARDQDRTILTAAGSALVVSDSMDLRREGLKLFERASALFPTSADARLGLASALYQTGSAEPAEKIYREWLAQNPNDVRALNDLAWILQEHYRRYDAALELANRGLKLAPENLSLLDTRGVILANLPDRLADAKNDFIQLANPDVSGADTRERAKALLWLGRICDKLDELTEAIQYLQSALEIDRKMNVFTPDERSEIARILQRAGTRPTVGT